MTTITTAQGWTRVPIEEIYLNLYDGPHATPAPAEEGPVFLGIKNITEDGRLDLSEIRHIAERDFNDWTRRVEPRPGDIVFTYEATLNRYAIIPKGFRGCLGRRLALIRPDPTKVDTRFLFYYFFGDDWRRTIAKHTLLGSTVDRIPLTTFPKFQVALPALPTQRKIASVLSAYDDLIENNTRRIAILEEMAQALYREWFVHFRFPGHEQVRMVESLLGPIPEGWTVGQLQTLATLVRGGVDPGRFPQEAFEHFSIPAFDERGLPALEYGETIMSTKFRVPQDCILLSKINPRIPRVWLPCPSKVYQAIASTEFLVLTPKRPVTSAFLLSLCRSQEFALQFAARALGTSTSHQRVKPDDSLSLPTLLPSQPVLASFTDIVQPLLTMQHNLRERGANLRRTRDLLLPKLISGEIDVKGLTHYGGGDDAL